MKNAFLDTSHEIAWSQLRPELAVPAMDEALADAKGKIDAICAVSPAEATFESSFAALDRATEVLDVAWTKINHLDSVQNSAKLREAVNTLLPRVTAFYTGIPLNGKLYAVLKGYAESAAGRAEEGVRRRFIEETLAEFRDAGAELPPERKAELERIEAALAEKTQKFGENVLDATNDFSLVVEDKARLAGLPDYAVEQARQDALDKGHGSEERPAYRFTLQMPSYQAVAKYADDASLRREMWKAFSVVGEKAPFDNTALVWEVLELRDRKAQLLGKRNFADLVLARRMAKSGTSALAFIEDMHARVRPNFDAEVAELEAFRAERQGDERRRLEPWEVAYWSEKLRQAKFDFDENELRPYFNIKSVIAGMFRLAERLFDVSVEELPAACLLPKQEGGDGPDAPADANETWHRDVKYYRLADRTGRALGYFYADWHPRETKRGGAWMNSLVTGMPALHPEAEGEPHVGLICGNLTPPAKGKPALLDHREVETIFHEFGHLLHHLLSEVEIKSLAGTNVAWDFVELPSQILENWCWEKECLDDFARHYETGEPIPDTLYDKMIKARNFQSAMFKVRQLSFGKIDLELHANYAAHRGSDLDDLADALLDGYVVPTRTRQRSILRRFRHLFSSSTGYAAGYYSYKWAEVLDADAFTRFQKEGVMSPNVGMEFRSKILSKGNSEPPEKLFRDFMGRDPDPEALLTRAGLV